MTKDETMEFLETLTEKYSLDYGNGDTFEQGDDFIWNVEAPNNTTIEVWLNNYKEMTRNDIIDELVDTLYDFDPEEVFKDLWYRDFEYSPFTFMDMLKEDEQYFDETIKEIKATRDEFE